MLVRVPIHGMQGPLEKQKNVCFSPARACPDVFVGGGSDGSDAFQHAAFTGNEKKRQKQRGRAVYFIEF
jgi:hypothetical protein